MTRGNKLEPVPVDGDVKSPAGLRGLRPLRASLAAPVNGALVMGRPRSDAVLRATLDRFLAQTDAEQLAKNDPVELVRAYPDPHDQEVAGLLVAALAYGRVASIKDKARALLALLGPRPAERLSSEDGPRALAGFVYRFQRGEDLPRFARAIGQLRRRHGSLASAFLLGVAKEEADYGGALDRLVGRLREEAGEPLGRGLAFLMPRVDGLTGAAKRLCLYLRWMIRPAGPVDLGAWPALVPGRFDPRLLIIPLDTHIERIGRYIGLSDRQTPGMATAREITAALRRLRPEDPLAYDLALCHLGIGGSCPRKRDRVRCKGCPIKKLCRLGKEPPGFGDDPV